MKRLLGYFLRGLVITTPAAVTAYVCWKVFQIVDGWLGIRIPGVGFAVTIALITLAGFLGSTILTRGLIGLLDQLLERLPFVRLLYTATKDLLNAFVGEKRRFEVPVFVSLTSGADSPRLLGFITQSTLAAMGHAEHVAVYCPHSYNFSGQLVVVPRAQVQQVDAQSSEFMAFVVSGGVTDIPMPETKAVAP